MILWGIPYITASESRSGMDSKASLNEFAMGLAMASWITGTPFS
ncbi:hypothetical protein [Thermococcus barossii]|nr:hypothetical protein [Thermococcus barossii]